MYKLTNTNAVIRLSDNAFIPDDPANSDYQEYLKWLSKGFQPEPYSEAPSQESDYIPTVVSMRQARLALLQVGLLDVVNQSIENSGNPAAKIIWEYATEVRREDALVKNLSVSMNITEQDLDDLFKLAGTI